MRFLDLPDPRATVARRVPKATWGSQESLDRRGGREIRASKAPLDSQDPRVFLASKERRVNLELMVGREPPALLARMGLTDRRASWAALDPLAARETLEAGGRMDTKGKPAAQGSEETKVPRGILDALDAGAPPETPETREARGTKATTEPQEVQA